MNTIDAPQGSPLWHAARANRFCASEAPAMMGASPYLTRSELLQRKATGITPDVDAATQSRFNAGHLAEELYRPLAERVVGDDLYPVVGTLDVDDLPLLASFDGITMNGTTVWEHKLYSATAVAEIDEGLTPKYYWQLEHQLLVSGAERALFVMSDGTDDKRLMLWYASNAQRRAQLVAGWKQFAADLDAYRDNPPTPVAPIVAAPTDSLPAVVVRVDGVLAVTGNLPAFGDALRSFIERIPDKPQTDQEFADAEASCKALKKAEDALESAEGGALAQIADVEQMRRAVADLRNLARTTRLRVEKLVVAEKDARKREIVMGAQSALAEHVRAMNARLGAVWLREPDARFADAIKGLKSLDSMRDKIAVALTNAKLEASNTADLLAANRKALVIDGENWVTLFPDFASVGTKPREDFDALAALRIAKQREAEAARVERERVRIEEAARAEHATREKIAREQAEAARAERTEDAEATHDQSPPSTTRDAIEAFLASRQWPSQRDRNVAGALLADFVPFFLFFAEPRQRCE